MNFAYDCPELAELMRVAELDRLEREVNRRASRSLWRHLCDVWQHGRGR